MFNMLENMNFTTSVNAEEIQQQADAKPIAGALGQERGLRRISTREFAAERQKLIDDEECHNESDIGAAGLNLDKDNNANGSFALAFTFTGLILLFGVATVCILSQTGGGAGQSMDTSFLQAAATAAEAGSGVATLYFKSGPIGIGADWESGMVTDVAPGGQGDMLGVKQGWRFTSVNGAIYSEDALNKCIDGSHVFEVKFAVAPAGPDSQYLVAYKAEGEAGYWIRMCRVKEGIAGRINSYILKSIYYTAFKTYNSVWGNILDKVQLELWADDVLHKDDDDFKPKCIRAFGEIFPQRSQDYLEAEFERMWKALWDSNIIYMTAASNIIEKKIQYRMIPNGTELLIISEGEEDYQVRWEYETAKYVIGWVQKSDTIPRALPAPASLKVSLVDYWTQSSPWRRGQVVGTAAGGHFVKDDVDGFNIWVPDNHIRKRAHILVASFFTKDRARERMTGYERPQNYTGNEHTITFQTGENPGLFRWSSTNLEVMEVKPNSKADKQGVLTSWRFKYVNGMPWTEELVGKYMRAEGDVTIPHQLLDSQLLIENTQIDGTGRAKSVVKSVAAGSAADRLGLGDGWQFVRENVDRSLTFSPPKHYTVTFDDKGEKWPYARTLPHLKRGIA